MPPHHGIRRVIERFEPVRDVMIEVELRSLFPRGSEL
jgi:hypothetical protein